MPESATNKDTTTGESATMPTDPTPESDLGTLLRRPLRESSPCPNAEATGVALGRIVCVDQNSVWVILPGLHAAPLPARMLCPLPSDWAERQCAVLFENGDLTRPMVMGLLMDSPQNLLQEPTQSKEPAEPDKALRVDGERVVIRADEELELRCGESVILLLRDGRIEIRGNYITSQATATQRLRGGSIHMN